MIFDLTQGHQFDPRMKILLAFCSAIDLIYHMTMFEIFFDPLGTSISFVRTNTKFGIKIFEIDFVIEIK